MSILAIGAQKPDMDFDEWLKKAGAQFGINPSGSNSVGGGGGGNDLRSDFEKKHNLKAGGSAWDAAKQDSNITANTSTINRGSEASSTSVDNKANWKDPDGSVFSFISTTQTDGVKPPPGVQFAMNPATTQALDPTQKGDNTERSDDSTQGQNSGAKMQTAVSAYEEWCKTHMSGGAGGAGTLSGTETTADTSQTGGTSGADGKSGADTTSGPEAKTETGSTAETPTKDTTVNDANDQTGVNNDDQTKGKDTSNEGDQAINKQEQKQQETKMEKEEENKRQQMVREREQQQAA